jgi:hypothetical protein
VVTRSPVAATPTAIAAIRRAVLEKYFMVSSCKVRIRGCGVLCG